jgi:ABC-2 type transport system ATP-binding protein
MILSILFPDRGELSVLGRRSALESKDRIGYLPEERGLYRKMKVGAFLAYMARIKGVTGDVSSRVRAGLERVGLPEVAGRKCEELSKGMQQKVQFLAATIHDPELLILDEPFSGLDPVNMRLLRDLIRAEHDAGKTVIFSTHVMIQAEQLCDQIFMIHDGRKVLDASMDQIRARFDPRTLRVEAADGKPDLVALRNVRGVRDVQQVDGVVEVSLNEDIRPTDAVRDLAAATPLVRIELRRPTLEDVFVQIVQGSSLDAAALRATLRATLGDDAEIAQEARR